MININNRRYIGSKYKLLDFILEEINKAVDNKRFSFADPFAGTGVVSYAVAQQGNKVILNDTLFSNYVAYKAWFSSSKIDEKKISDFIYYFNSLEYNNISGNYFSEIYGDKYFSINDAKKIGFIREYIELNRNKFTEREYYILLTSLIYASDKIANTVGHFEYFLKSKPKDCNLRLDNLELETFNDCQIFNEDANDLCKKISADVFYIDPPYNARQYVNFYHVLENLARWNKPKDFEGNSMKFKRDALKSGYSRSIAPKLLAELIDSLNCKVIIVSYNNTYSARSLASNNKINEEQILQILSKKGIVSKREIDHNYFNAGKTFLPEHKENLYICKVR